MKEAPLAATFECTLSAEQVRALPDTEQADMAYWLFGAAADKLVEFGFDPTIVAGAAEDLGSDLYRLDGGPKKVWRVAFLAGRPSRERKR